MYVTGVNMAASEERDKQASDGRATHLGGTERTEVNRLARIYKVNNDGEVMYSADDASVECVVVC